MSEPTTSDPPLTGAGAPVLSDSGPPLTPVGAGRPEAAGKRRSRVRSAVEWLVIIAVALALALTLRAFLFQAFYIPSESMEPTLKPGDRVLVNKLSYHLHDIHRGDIVVFKRPPSEADDPTIKDLIKRVIGLPGETIEARQGQVFINGRPIKESYLPAGSHTTDLPSRVVPTGQYFVLGDNRSNSKDSRFIGPIAGKLIVGRAFVRVWPLSGLGFL